MTESEAQYHTGRLLSVDSHRMAILKAVADLNLPDCFVAAGFLRNLIWDHLHGFPPTPLNDIDVVFYESAMTISEEQQRQKLHEQLPDYDFDVKNQARMHLKHDHQPYANSSEAMTHWVELETAVAVRLDKNGDFKFATPFGLVFLFDGKITPNPDHPEHLFNERLTTKNWQVLWPKLQVVKHG